MSGCEDAKTFSIPSAISIARATWWNFHYVIFLIFKKLKNNWYISVHDNAYKS